MLKGNEKILKELREKLIIYARTPVGLTVHQKQWRLEAVGQHIQSAQRKTLNPRILYPAK